MATKAQATVSMLLAAGTVVLVGVVGHSALAQSQDQFTGVIAGASVAPLNFPHAGTIDSVDVRPGETVHKGQVLATEDTAAVDNELAAAQDAIASDQAIEAADQAAARADQARVADLTSAAATSSAQQQQSQLQVTQAEQRLQQAQTDQQDAAQVQQQIVAEANAKLAGDEGVLSTDTATFDSQCPVMPPPQYLAQRCDDLQNQVARDQSVVSTQESQVQVDEAQSASSAAQASDAVQRAETQLSLAQTQQAQQATADAGSTAAAQAAVDRDQAQVDRDQAALARDETAVQAAHIARSQLSIVAPADGVVLSVGGQAGTLAASDGVHEYGDAVGQASLPQPSGLFSLLPPVSSSASTGAGQSGVVPMFQLRESSAWVVTARVAETALSAFRVGRRADVSVSDAGVSGVPASVASISQTPQVVGGVVDYVVELRVLRPLPSAVLSGMTADFVLV